MDILRETRFKMKRKTSFESIDDSSINFTFPQSICNQVPLLDHESGKREWIGEKGLSCED